MTPESLSREGSPGPNEIHLHPASAANVQPTEAAAHPQFEVKTTNLTPGVPTSSHHHQIPAAAVLNATVLTASGQPIQLTQQPGGGLAGLGGPQKLIVTQQGPGGQPRLIVPAQQLALLSNGGPPQAASNNTGEAKKDGKTLGNLRFQPLI